MEELEDLNEELKKYIIFNEYGLPNIEYPYYQFNIYYNLYQHFNEINELFIKQKTYIDLLLKHDSKLNFKVVVDDDGKTSIHHSQFIEIKDIENYSIGEINDFFDSQKKNIDWVKNIDDEIRNFIIKDKNGIISILHNSFELLDVLKYSPFEINDKFTTHLLKQKEWLDKKKYKKYVLSFPLSKRMRVFDKLTEKPKKITISYKNIQEKEIWELSDIKYWEFLRFLYNEYSEPDGVLYEIFLPNTDRKYKEFFMTYEERMFFNNLPDEFFIYRGFVRRQIKKNKQEITPEIDDIYSIGLYIDKSYTLSKEIGIKYFEKYKIYNGVDDFGYINESKLSKYKVKKEIVFGYLNHNNEQEILIIYEDQFF